MGGGAAGPDWLICGLWPCFVFYSAINFRTVVCLSYSMKPYESLFVLVCPGAVGAGIAHVHWFVGDGAGTFASRWVG